MPINTFATLINEKVLVPSSRTNYMAIEKNHLVDFMKPLLKTIHFDEAWYMHNNPDVFQAISEGAVASAIDHYVTFGYYEHRMPYEIEVDASWYVAQYADVQEAVSKGDFSSAREHYYVVGFKEGRLPHANFALKLLSEHAHSW